MEGIEKDKYATILNMEGYQPVVAMSVGYACQDDYNRLEVAPKTRRAHKEIIDSII